MSLDFLDNLLESANDNPEWAIGAGVAAFATMAVTAYYTCCRTKAGSHQQQRETPDNNSATPQKNLTAHQQQLAAQKQQQQQLAHEFELLERNQGTLPPRRNQLK